MSDNNDIKAFFVEAIRRAMLEQWDPIGVINIAEARDEYDDYVFDLYKRLVDGGSKSEVFDYLWSLETQHMGLSGNRDVTDSFSGYLIDLRQRAFWGK
jgi:hypothetical protein